MWATIWDWLKTAPSGVSLAAIILLAGWLAAVSRAQDETASQVRLGNAVRGEQVTMHRSEMDELKSRMVRIESKLDRLLEAIGRMEANGRSEARRSKD